MSFLKKNFRKIKDFGSSNNSTDSVPSKTEGVGSGTSTPLSLNGNGTANGNGNSVASGTRAVSLDLNPKRQSSEIILADRQRKSLDKLRLKAENKKRQSLAKIEDENFLATGPPALTKLYRPYSMNMSKRWNHENRVLFKDLDFESMFTLDFPVCTYWI